MKKLLLSALLTFSQTFAEAATNDLVITSITRQGDCTTLTWRSHPGEYYTVYRAVSLQAPVFWQVAEVNVPSGGTNTTWSEGDCAESMVASAPPPPAMSAEERAAFLEKFKDYETPAWLYPPGHPKNPDRSNPIKSPYRLELEKSGGLEAALALSGGSAAGAMFYRVARTAVVGTVDGSEDPPSGLTNIIAVAAGAGHNLALRSNGVVTAWGNNFYGESTVPTNLTDVVSVAAGFYHSLAVKRDGSVAMWGDNTYGQITNAPPGLTNIVDMKAGYWHTMVLKADGTVAAWGRFFPTTNAVPLGLSNVTAISAGTVHCLALKSDGTVTGWGFFGGIPTNVPATLTNVVAIAAGQSRNYALLKSGTVVVWNNSGFLTNQPAGFSNVTGIAAQGVSSGLALKADTSLVGWSGTQVYPGLSNAVAIAAGGGEFGGRWLCIITNSGNVVIRKQPQSLAIPLGRNTNIFVTATGAAPLNYQWEKQSGTNWSQLSGETNATLAFASFQDTNDGVYRVRVTNAVSGIWSSNAHRHAPANHHEPKPGAGCSYFTGFLRDVIGVRLQQGLVKLHLRLVPRNERYPRQRRFHKCSGQWAGRRGPVSRRGEQPSR
jgi:hypothetical protein